MTPLYTFALLSADSDRALRGAHWRRWQQTIRYRVNWWFVVLTIAPEFFLLRYLWNGKGLTSVMAAFLLTALPATFV